MDTLRGREELVVSPFRHSRRSHRFPSVVSWHNNAIYNFRTCPELEEDFKLILGGYKIVYRPSHRPCY